MSEASTPARRADALILFGATGDLAFKKIFPALQSMAQLGQLDMPVVVLTREGRSKETMLARARQSVETYGGGADGAALAGGSIASSAITRSRWFCKTSRIAPASS